MEGLYDDVQEPSEREDLVETYLTQSRGNQPDLWLGIASFTKERTAFLKRFFFEPALNIEGIQSSYQRAGVRDFAGEASAKLSPFGSWREPHDAFWKIRKQLDKNGFDKVELYYTLGGNELSK